ncbi:MAG: FAD-binding oxidoreductase, partial [Mesorhizobium sp.]
ARLGSVLLRGQPLPDDLAARGVTSAALAPDRFLTPATTP